MSGEDCETARRLIAKIMQFTKPGQIELPLDWVVDRAKKEHVSNVIEDVSVSEKQNFDEGVAEETSDENLEDGELLEDDEEEGEIYDEKENDNENVPDKLSSPPKASSDSLNTNPNGSANGACSKKLSAKQKAKRQKFKHMICRFFREGNCRDGEACSYSHNAADSHRTPELCKGYISGKCRKALKCHLLHGEHPCKDFVFGRCNVLKCRFSHQPLNDYTRAVFEKTLKEQNEAATSANLIPISRSPPCLISLVHGPQVNFIPQSFSISSNPKMHANPNSLSYNNNTKQNIAPYHVKKPSPKSTSSIPLRNIPTIDSLLSEITSNSLPNLHQSC